LNKRDKARFVVQELRKSIPRPETELEYRNPYQLIIAVILSAQCTDERVNLVTPDLYARFPDVHALAEAEPEEILPYIKSVTYPNNKSRHLAGMARKVVAEFEGKIPGTMEELMTLPGVGRKTAQVVVSVAFDVDALPVDTHIFRVANRIGIADNARTPLAVERQLKTVIQEGDWSEAHHLLILHGRYTCTARTPKCDTCALTTVCRYYERLRALPGPINGLVPAKGKFYCRTRDHYFDRPDSRVDRYGTRQISCPRCGSMNVFESKSGASTRRVQDYRVA
jgi:endonuclease-3